MDLNVRTVKKLFKKNGIMLRDKSHDMDIPYEQKSIALGVYRDPLRGIQVSVICGSAEAQFALFSYAKDLVNAVPGWAAQKQAGFNFRVIQQ